MAKPLPPALPADSERRLEPVLALSMRLVFRCRRTRWYRRLTCTQGGLLQCEIPPAATTSDRSPFVGLETARG